MVSKKEFGVSGASGDSGEDKETEGDRVGETGKGAANGENETAGTDGTDTSDGGEGADVGSKKEANTSDMRANARGESGNLGSWQLARGVSDSMVSATFIGPVGMSLELKSDPKTFEGKDKLTDRLISMEPDILTVTEAAMLNNILEKKTEKLTLKARCSNSI